MKQKSQINLGKKAKGFTLIELIVVIVILGIVMLMVARTTSGSSDPANAQAIRKGAKTLTEGIGYLHANLGNGLSATANPLPTNGLSLLDVLMVGRTAVATAYQNGYDQANMRPLESDFSVVTRPSGSTPGTYQLLTYPVSFVACTTGHVCTQFTKVPSSTVQELASKYGLTNFVAATAVTTGPVRYTAADSSGFHVVTLDNVP